LVAMYFQRLTLVQIAVTAIAIVALLAFTVWQRIRASKMTIPEKDRVIVKEGE
jgi:UDP-GlcNAc:undecaprenyl-phosphate/decaprenyl-phosphate GlcNAc-1-phosphate transferase